MFFSDDWLGGGFRRSAAISVNTEALRDHVVIFLFVWGLCEV